MRVRALREWLLTVPDHRGRRWRVAAVVRSPRRGETRGRRVYRRIAATGVCLSWGFVVVSGLAIAARMRSFGVPEITRQANIMTAMAVVIGAMSPLGYVLLVRLMAGAAVRRCLATRVCPSCSYSLEGIDAEADGCTVCPECGGAWRAAARAKSARTPLPAEPVPSEARGPIAELRRLYWRWGTIGDARGARWSVLLSARADRAHRGRRLLQGLVDAILMFAALLVIDAVLVAAIWVAGGDAALARGGGSLALVASVSLTMALYVANARQRAPRRIVEALASGFCPVCGESLDGVEPGTDGCVVCRECEAAWRLPAPGEP